MKTRMPYAQAKAIADRLVTLLSPYCERIEIAGSVRREKVTIGDIELVAIPKTVAIPDLLGGESGQVSVLSRALENPYIFPWRKLKGGGYYKQFELPECNLDLFITTPEKWGVIFMIRTGSAEFTHWVMIPKRYGGGMPAYLKISEGRVWQGGEVLETPEEADVFEALGLDWIEPKDRERYWSGRKIA